MPPPRGAHLQDEDAGAVTVAELLGRNQGLLFWYRLAQYRREHAGQPRRVTVLPRPCTAETQFAVC